MERQPKSDHLLTSLLILIVMVLFYIQSPSKVLATSPSFPRFTTTVPPEPAPHDVEDSLIGRCPNLPSDISSVAVNSDGRTLNGTLWLSSRIYVKPIDEQPYCKALFDVMRYGMRIFVTDYSHASYDMYVQKEMNGTWTKHLVEYEPQTKENRSLYVKPNYDEFFKDGSRYVHLSLNLDSIGSPAKYTVLLYTATKDSYLTDCIPYSCIDHTYQLLIPPPIIAWPHPAWPDNITLQAGSEAYRLVRINPTDFMTKYADVFNETHTLTLKPILPKGLHLPPGLKFTFNPPIIVLPPSKTAVLHVSTASNTPPGNFTFPINETFTSSANKLKTTPIPDPGFKITIIKRPPTPSILEGARNSLSANSWIALIIPVLITTGFFFLFPKIRRDDILKNIAIADLLQIDGTVIVGVLILLTLASTQLGGLHRSPLVVGLLTGSIVAPFALSVIISCVALTHKHPAQARLFGVPEEKPTSQLGVRFTISGFVYLLVAIIFLAFIQ
jgi:hypothetical protein